VKNYRKLLVFCKLVQKTRLMVIFISRVN